MKYLIILLDGMADWPIESLGGRTPLAVARTPNLDFLASRGIVGRVRTVPEGMAPGSDVANLAVLGYDPARYYTGRSSLEALARGIDLLPDDVSWRANLVTLTGEGPFETKILSDFSGGEIPDALAAPLLDAARPLVEQAGFALHQGISYRNLLLARGGSTGTITTPPHDIQGRPIGDYLPRGTCGAQFARLMAQSHEILSRHPLVLAGKTTANCLWFWGEGTAPQLPGFAALRGLRGGVVCAVDLIKGIARAAGMQVLVPPTATGGMVTDYAAKCEAAKALFAEGAELVFVHIEAPDECGHHNDPAAKIRAIEAIDRDIAGPLFDELTQKGEPFRLLALPDHPTPCAIGTHTAEPVPFLLYASPAAEAAQARGPVPGGSIPGDLTLPPRGALAYTEAAAATSPLRLPSGEALMSLLLR